MRLINRTGVRLNIIHDTGLPIEGYITIPYRGGTVPYLVRSPTRDNYRCDGIPIIGSINVRPVLLPKKRKGHIYIIPACVGVEVRERPDLCYPGNIERSGYYLELVQCR